MAKPQLSFIKNSSTNYGGALLKTRQGRSRGRPLDTKNSMHLVLRSSKAKGPWSFLKTDNRRNIQLILKKFSSKYGIQILSMANVGSHLHLQIQLANRHTYPKFIRAVTAAIAMSITGVNRWTQNVGEKLKFWDLRPFTRVIFGFRSVLALKDYIKINHLEGMGVARAQAENSIRTAYREFSTG